MMLWEIALSLGRIIGVEWWVQWRSARPGRQALKWKQRSRTRATKSQFSLASKLGASCADGGWSSASIAAASSSRDQTKARKLTTKDSDLPLTQGNQSGWKLEPEGKWIGIGFVFLWERLEIFPLATHSFPRSSGSLASSWVIEGTAPGFH